MWKFFYVLLFNTYILPILIYSIYIIYTDSFQPTVLKNTLQKSQFLGTLNI